MIPDSHPVDKPSSPDGLPDLPLDASAGSPDSDAEALLTALPDACFVLDQEWRLTYVNPPAEKLLGRLCAAPPGGLLGRSIVQECPEVADSTFCKGCREAHAEKKFTEAEAFYPTLGRWFTVFLRPMGNRLCVFLRDVTERARLERELHRGVEELAEAERGKAELERGKDAFLVQLAHEIRNAFAPVRNALHLIGLGNLGPDEARACSLAEQGVRRLSGLVDALMTVSRFTLAPPDKQRVNLKAVLTQALAGALMSAGEEGRTFTVQAPPGALWLEADPRQLEQIVGQLLDNAIRSTGPTGAIRVSAAREEGAVVLRVRDDGVGLAPEVLSQAFNPFTRQDSGPASTQWGQGVGLKLVRRLVDLHGGSVEARSEGPNRGSEFVIRLPALEDPPAEVAGPPTPREDGLLQVLLVEDDVETAQSLSLLLGGWGCEVHLASDGAGALDAIRARRPDLVLMDIGLPGMDGYEVAERLRREEGGARLPLVALTGYGQDEDRDQAREAGFDYHMVKPVDPLDLKDLVQYYIGLLRKDEV
jgi:signal transduction histidine kinase/CheY-like chemotaxis protein